MRDSVVLNVELCRMLARDIIGNSFASTLDLDSETEEKLKNIARYLQSVYAADGCAYETLRSAHDKAMAMLEQYHQASKTALSLLEAAVGAVEQSKKQEETLIADLEFVHKKPNLPEDIRTNALGMLEKIQDALDSERSRQKDVMESIQNELNHRMDWMKACLHGPGIAKHASCEFSPHACMDTEESDETLSPTEASEMLDKHSSFDATDPTLLYIS